MHPSEKELGHMAQRVTINDVARAAGMSRAQAARAMADGGSVKPETREHVRQVAHKLGYRVNHAARQLASKTSRDIGIIIGEPLNPYHILLARAVDEHLFRQGYSAIMSLNSQRTRSTLGQVEHMVTLGAAGVILISSEADRGILQSISELLPTVYYGQSWPEINLTSVALDDAPVVRAGILRLVALGHKSIAHIEGDHWPGADRRREGYQEAMRMAGLCAQSVTGGHDLDGGRRGVEQLHALGKMPTAIFADNDLAAIGAINRLYGMGYRIPDDVSVIGFDDIPDAGSETLSLSTFRNDVEAHAEQLVNALGARLSNSHCGPVSLLTAQAQFILRRSVTDLRSQTKDEAPL
ncbi:LacI family transcriptional regulator [Thioclava sp. BHET1]|nr:LacI family transcriptional regulator [Thioclava sp. BHET1]